MNDENELVINEKKLKRMIEKIIKLENENVKTGEKNPEEMKKQIEKIIEEELKCY